MNEVKRVITGRLACEAWDERTKNAVAKNAELVMERAIELAAGRGKLPVNGNLAPVMHIVTNELITNIADDPDNAIHLVAGVVRKIGVVNGNCEEATPHQAKASTRGQSGASRA